MADESSSKYRVALASTDGETVNQHYGRADLFYIYLVDDEEGYDLIEKRKVLPVCRDGGHIASEMLCGGFETWGWSKCGSYCQRNYSNGTSRKC